MTQVDFKVSELPEVVRIEPSGLCNLRCRHCPTGIKKSVDRAIMSVETFEIILANLEQLKPRVVVMYHGGEPFLNKHIFDWIKAVKEIGVGFVKTVTNGNLLTDDMLSGILDSGLDSIEFSIDGQSPDENNAIRVGGNYCKVANTIKNLIRMKRERSKDKPAIIICTTQFLGQNTSITADEPPTQRFILDDFKSYNGNEITYKNTWALYWPGLEGIKDSDILKVEKQSSSLPTEEVNFCPHPVETLTIRWNGDIVACCYDLTSQYVIGNIKESTLSEIWNNEKYIELRRSIHDKRYLALCNNCHVIRPHQFIQIKVPVTRRS